MSSILQLLVFIFPLALMTGLTIFFIRLFKKTSAKESELVKEIASLEALKRKAEWREARIVSVHPELPSRFDPANRILNLKLEITGRDNKIQLLKTRWKVDTTVLSGLQPDNVIQVKVYNELVFPAIDGAALNL
jgi:hypothetical protein